MNIIFQSCRRGNSFFKFIDEYWKSKSSNNRAFHRLCSLMRKMNAQNVVIEDLKLGSDQETDEDINALSIFFDQKIEFIGYKISFLDCAINSADEIKHIENKHFLGYGIILNVKYTNDDKEQHWLSYILRAIIKLPNTYTDKDNKKIPLHNVYYHIYNHFVCDIKLLDKDGVSIIRTYDLTGTFFSQQNEKTSVCAHASLKTMINNLSNVSPFLITSEYINKNLGINHKSQKAQGGLSREQVEKILKDIGLDYSINNYFDEPHQDYANDLHHRIESASPCLLIFTTKNIAMQHVVPVLGHTINYDLWLPEAEKAYRQINSRFRSATLWLDNFIIHDDNFGMYLSLPANSLKRKTDPNKDPEFRAHSILSIDTKQFKTKGYEAELACQILIGDILNEIKEYTKDLYWYQVLYNEQLAPLIIRTALMGKERYMTHLGYKLKNRNIDSNNDQFKDDIIEKIASVIPEIFWICEVTLPDLYTTNKTKLVDFIYDCQCSPLSPIDKEGNIKNDEDIVNEMLEKCKLIRLPGLCIKKDEHSNLTL